jgi:hypothetical protein
MLAAVSPRPQDVEKEKQIERSGNDDDQVVKEAIRVAGPGRAPTIIHYIQAYHAFMTKEMPGPEFDQEIARIAGCAVHSVEYERSAQRKQGKLPTERRGIRVYVLPPTATVAVAQKDKDGDDMDEKHVKDATMPSAPPSSPVMTAAEAVASGLETKEQQDHQDRVVRREADRLAGGRTPTIPHYFLAYHSFMTKAVRGVVLDQIIAYLSGRHIASVQATRSAMGLDGRLPVEMRGAHQYVLPPGAVPAAAAVAASSSNEKKEKEEQPKDDADDDTETEDDTTPLLRSEFKQQLETRAAQLSKVKLFNLPNGPKGRIGCGYYILAYVETLKDPESIHIIADKVEELSGFYSYNSVLSKIYDLERDQRFEIKDFIVNGDEIVSHAMPLTKPLPGPLPSK